MDSLDPPLAMREAAERGLPLTFSHSQALDPVGSVPGSWRDLAIRAGRPSPILRWEALAAREAARQALLLQQAQVGVSWFLRGSCICVLNRTH